MKYKAVIADVDGTLIPPNAAPTTKASDRVVQAVLAAQEKGILFSLASARSLDWVQGLVGSLNIKAPLILDNGARIYDTMTQKYIFESFIEEESILNVLKVLSQFPYDIYIVDGKKRFTYNPGDNLNANKAVKIMILHINPQEAETIYQEVKKIQNVQVTKSVSGENPVRESIHVTSIEAKKDFGLYRVAKFLGLSTKEFIGIGDSYNDLTFLLACGLKVAMGNAVPEVKAIADYVAPSYEEDGVADAIERYILKEN